MLVDCFAPVITLVGKTWDLHLDKVVRVSREENLAMIGDSVRFCVEQGKEVVYDAEHFFDGYAADRDYALRCLRRRPRPARANVTHVRHQRRDAAGAGGRGRAPTCTPRSAPTSRSASTRTTTRSAPSPTRSPRSRPARGSCRAR